MGLLDALGLKLQSTVASGAGGDTAQEEGGVAGSRARGGADASVAQQGVFTGARVGAVALIDALKSHPQAAAVQAIINQAGTKLGIADGHAAKSEWPQAMQALEDVKALCATGKKAADDRQAFSVKLANAVMGRNALQGFDPGLFGTVSTGINNARAQAAAGNYVAANATLDGVGASIQAKCQSWVNTVTTKLANSTANVAVAAFLKDDIDFARGHVTAATAALGAGRWSECLMAATTAIGALAATERMAARRLAYDTARATAVTAIGGVKAVPAIADRGAGLEALLAEADRSAQRDTAKFEAGQAILADIGRRCTAIVAAGASTDAYKKGRPLAEAELAALDAHPAAARVATVRESARKQLAEAAKAAAGAATAVDPGPGWSAALTALTRLRADLAAAKTLADGAGSAAAAEAAAAQPTDLAAMKAALKSLQADQAKAAAAPFAAEAAVPLKTCEDQADKADKALAKDDGKAAAAALAQAARALLEAKDIQVAQARFAADLPAVEARLAKLQGLPRAAVLKGMIDPVAKALAEAKAKSKAKAGAEAIAALRRATDLADAADKADLERGKFDTAAALTATHAATIADAKARKPLDQAIADARKQADAFRFGEAMAALKKTEVAIDKAELSARAAANPADPAIATLAAQMTANGGAAEVDKLVADAKTTDPRMIAALGTGRFGVTMVPDTSPGVAAEEAKSMKALYNTFASVPDHVKASGSISRITHTDATGAGGVGGAWSTSSRVTLSGRPNLGKQKFGTALEADAPGGGKVKQLPADIDKDCLATGADSELLGFTALHEVGHGVDDANGYMLKNGGKPDHGGWVNYGSGVQPIADAVGAHVRAKVKGSNTFYTKAEDRKYVLDKLLNQKPARPATLVAGSDDEKAYQEFDNWHRLAVSPGVYERQGDCDTLTIGTMIYHEAYPREWVGYEAAARKRGLTGYQFRAPAEWFAELYAAYKSNLLGPKHPSREWLKKL